MKKQNFTNICAIVCISLATYCLYILLLDSILPFSIGSVLIRMNHLTKHSHILAIGLVPVYIGLMIFGTTLVAFYLGNLIQRFLSQFFNSKPLYSTRCKNDAIHLVRKSPYQINSKVG